MCILKKKFTFEFTVEEFTVEEFLNYIALLFYIVTDPNISAYWSKLTLYCGL